MIVQQMLRLSYGISLDNNDYRDAFLACSEWRDREVAELKAMGCSESPYTTQEN